LPPTPEYTKILNVSKPIGLNIFSYINSNSDEVNNRKNIVYTQNTLQPNMYLLVPYGNLPNNLFFRGASLHQNPLENSLKFIPQVDWEEILSIEKSLFNLSGQKLLMGWKLLKIVSVPPISWNIFSDGWLPNNTEIFYPKELLGSRLTLYGQAFSATHFKTTCQDSSDIQLINHQNQSEQQSQLTIELNCSVPVTGYNDIYLLRLEKLSSKQKEDDRNLLYLVKKVKLTLANKSKTNNNE
jgi:hypothetical protein